MGRIVNNNTGKGHHLRALLTTAVRENPSPRWALPFLTEINQKAGQHQSGAFHHSKPQTQTVSYPVGLGTPSFTLSTCDNRKGEPSHKSGLAWKVSLAPRNGNLLPLLRGGMAWGSSYQSLERH